MLRRKPKRRRPAPSRPFTPDEDEELRRMIGCGLSSCFWNNVMPQRRFGELIERAYQLSLPRAPLL